MICVLSGDTNKVRAQLSALRMEMAERLGLRKPNEFAPLWVIDFPLLELDEETGHYHAMHHPFTSPKPGQIELLDTKPGEVKANAYDLVLNGNEIGGGSIRIHDKETQAIMLKHLGFSEEEAKASVLPPFLTIKNITLRCCYYFSVLLAEKKTTKQMTFSFFFW